MKHIRNIFLPLILLLFLVITAHSQNEKLWEFDASPHGVYDVEHFGGDKFIYISHTQNTFYYITVRNLLDTTLVLQKEIPYRPSEIFISEDRTYFYIYSYFGEFIKYDYELNRLGVITPPQYEFEGSSEEGTANGYCDVDMNRNIAAVKQQKSTVDNRKEFRIVVMDLETGEELGSIKVSSNIEDVQISPDGRYITHPEDRWPAKVRFFDAQTYEHQFDIESTNDDDKDNSIEFYIFSPNGRYIIARVNGANDRYIGMDLFEESIYLNITNAKDVIFKSQIYFLGDDFLITRPRVFGTTPDAIVYRNRTFDSVHYFAPIVGLDKLSYSDNIIVSNYGSIITSFKFDPDILAVESTHDTVEVYPQPSSGVFNISLDESYLDKEYSIYNVAGNVVSKGIINNIDSGSFQLNTPDIPKGVYYFVVGDFRCKIVRE